ncbi:subtilisin-like protein [Annulohypoxylon moriforme]|nr:subtilisin-like protein [Annulohypoxylon moriforme]
MAPSSTSRANIAALRQKLAKEKLPLEDSTEVSGKPNAEWTPVITAEHALDNLFSQKGDDEERKTWLKLLGNAKIGYNRSQKGSISGMHEELAKKYQEEGRELATEKEVLDSLLDVENTKEKKFRLENLFAHGQDGVTILHVILDPSTYPTQEDPITHLPQRIFYFDRVKPLIRFLLRVHPGLPAVKSTDGNGPPIFMALEAKQTNSVDVDDEKDVKFGPSAKKQIVQFLCEEEDGGLASKAAIESMTQMVHSSENVSLACHAIHRAIESSDFPISKDVIRKLSKIEVPKNQQTTSKQSCLEICDGQGRTCLHMALTGPFNEYKIWWAETLTELCPHLLETTYTFKRNGKEEKLTPLQHFAEQKVAKRQESKRAEDQKLKDLHDKLEALEASLKSRCLAEFGNSTCKRIMYKKKNVKEIFLTLDDDIVSWEFLESQKRHYKLDTILKRIQISSSVSIQWDDMSFEARKIATEWGCAGNIDLFMVFYWLKKEIKVKKVLEVVVDDGAGSEVATDDLIAGGKKPHSDRAIIECLDGLGVETLNWRRMDIPADVIVKAAGNHVKTLYLYCSGLNAVLQSWADSQGLSRLEKLENVYLEIDQGLESIEWIRDYVKTFRTNLQKRFKELYPKREKELAITCKLFTQKRVAGAESAASKIKSKNEQGFEEQDWLKCMDEFADVMEAVEQPSNLKFGIRMPARPIKVALIDDGVKTSYGGLDGNIYAGNSGWEQLDTNKSQTGMTRQDYFRNYNSSHTGHGTVMAYYIKRVCPKVHFYVAKLEPEPQRGYIGGRSEAVTFSRESVAEAVKWAVEEEVDIISMSWAIDKGTTFTPGNEVGDPLYIQVQEALKKKILLFCANPDRGPNYNTNDTLPKAIYPNQIFCIGAATQDGIRWGQIDNDDKSCDYFLPGVELGIQVESTSRKNQDEPPKEWRKHSGSSLSCALAAGLAAMILHCSLVSGVVEIDSPKWKWLRSYQGMRKSFENIQIERSDSGWLPVRRFFQPAVKYLDSHNNEAKVKAVRGIVAKILQGWVPDSTAEINAEPGPGRLSKQPTLTSIDNPTIL